MNRLNQILLAMVMGLALSVLLAEALMRLLQLISDNEPLLSRLAAGALDSASEQLALALMWLLAASAGAAVTVGLSRLAFLSLPVGLGCGLPLVLTALVGMQPLGWAIALGLAPVLGALLGARLVQHLQQLDADRPARFPADQAGL